MKTTQTYKICDNLIGISELQDNSIDLTVTSPPYDSLRRYGGDDFTFKELANQLYRVTKVGGVVVWIIGDETVNGNESGTSFRHALYFKEIGFRLNDTMIWNKGGFTAVGALSYRYAQVFDYMFVFTKGLIKTYNPIKDRNNKQFGKVQIGGIRQKDGTVIPRSTNGKVTPQFGQRHNIWDIYPEQSNINRTAHPAQFPEQLAKDHILSWSNEGDWVLDPFLGSGTTLKMCMETNRNGIGFEINKGYENIIRKRLKLNHRKLDAYVSDSEQ